MKELLSRTVRIMRCTGFFSTIRSIIAVVVKENQSNNQIQLFYTRNLGKSLSRMPVDNLIKEWNCLVWPKRKVCSLICFKKTEQNPLLEEFQVFKAIQASQNQHLNRVLLLMKVGFFSIIGVQTIIICILIR